MKQLAFILLAVSLFISTGSFGQRRNSRNNENPATFRSITVEPGIGVHTNFGMDLLLSTLVQWNLARHFSLISHSSYNINNITQRSFNGIKTGYNYSLNQKFGIGTSLYSRKSAHTFSLMAGAKFTSFRETVNTPDNSKVSRSVHAFSPDYGFMYHLKKGRKNHFFSFRLYVPIYPWPVKNTDISYADGNMNNIALEFGVGFRIR